MLLLLLLKAFCKKKPVDHVRASGSRVRPDPERAYATHLHRFPRLKHADRIGDAQHRDGAGEPNAARTGRGRRQDHGRRASRPTSSACAIASSHWPRSRAWSMARPVVGSTVAATKLSTPISIPLSGFEAQAPYSCVETRAWDRLAKAERTLRNTRSQSAVTSSASGRQPGAMYK